MSPENFALRWPLLRAALFRRATRSLPSDVAESTVGRVLIYLLQRLPILPEEKEGEFCLQRYAYYLLRLYTVQEWKQEKRRVKTTGYTLPGQEEKDKEREHPALVEGARRAYEECRREQDTKETIRLILAAVSNAEDRRIFLLLCSGYSQSDVARVTGVSRQMVSLRYQRARKAILRTGVFAYPDW